MNQKEYELIASHISYGRVYFTGERSRKSFAKALAYELSLTYSNFDIDKFLQACGIEEDHA